MKILSKTAGTLSPISCPQLQACPRYALLALTRRGLLHQKKHSSSAPLNGCSGAVQAREALARKDPPRLCSWHAVPALLA